jgi:hypothetical protein
MPRVAKEGCPCINVSKAGLSPLSGARPLAGKRWVQNAASALKDCSRLNCAKEGGKDAAVDTGIDTWGVAHPFLQLT